MHKQSDDLENVNNFFKGMVVGILATLFCIAAAWHITDPSGDLLRKCAQKHDVYQCRWVTEPVAQSKEVKPDAQ